MSWFQFGVTTDVPSSQQFTFRQPVTTGKRAAIAQAAHQAGFDCSNASNLLRLIDAVVMANNQFGYPDRWDGPAAFQSSVYPDAWTPAHAARRENRQRHAISYEDEARPPAVPAFAASAKDIVHTLVQNPKQSKRGKKSEGITGANLIPLGDRNINKRTAEVQLPEIERFKRPKLETPSSQVTIIDLTQDENLPPSRQYATTDNLPHPTRSNVSRPVTARGYPMNRLNAQQRAAEAHQADAVAAGTAFLLEESVVRLRASVVNLDADREALRVRWEVDKRLQLLKITDHLKTLNDCFARAEEGLRDSVDVIERFIM